MTQWTDKHYDFNYTLTEKDIEAGSIKLDPYFVAKQWKTGSKDDSGALFHVLKTVARFGDKNDVEREVKALYAQVLGVANSFGVELERNQTQEFHALKTVHADSALWYPDGSGAWVEFTGRNFPREGLNMEVLFADERESGNFCHDWKFPTTGYSNWERVVAYKIVK